MMAYFIIGKIEIDITSFDKSNIKKIPQTGCFDPGRYCLNEAGDKSIIGSDVNAAKKKRTLKNRKPAAIL